MGNTWTVLVWLKDKYSNQREERIYWAGENMFAALYKFFEARKTKSGCITLEYRGANR